jgi:hypothetical protein
MATVPRLALDLVRRHPRKDLWAPAMRPIANLRAGCIDSALLNAQLRFTNVSSHHGSL